MQKILKFDENCINSAKNIKQIVRIIQQEQAQLTVVPAMDGIKKELKLVIKDELNIIEQIENKFLKCINELIEPEYKNIAIKELDKTIEIIKTSKNPRKIEAQGQILTAKIIAIYANQIGLNTEIIKATDIIFIDENKKPQVEQIMLRNDVYYITQGTICRNENGEIDMLPFGDDDYTATLIGAAINSKEVQIWSVDNMLHSGDTNVVEGTRAIENLSFEQAAELAYFNSSIIHPSVLMSCKKAKVNVILKNINKPNDLGTKITSVDNTENFLVAAAKDYITLVRIKSDQMLMNYGYVRKVMNVFEKYETSVDIITTSETAVAITIDDLTNIEAISMELKKLGAIEIEHANSIVCIIGNMAYEGGGIAATMFDTVNKTPIKMISYGASQYSISLLIESKHKMEMLRNINLLFR